MNREEFHEQDIDRYKFDFNLCTAEKGYAQIDTSQDAWYYGNWANPKDLKIVSYCEGDVTITTYNHSNGFVRQIRELKGIPQPRLRRRLQRNRRHAQRRAKLHPTGAGRPASLKLP